MSTSKSKLLLALILIVVVTASLILGSTLGVLAHVRETPASLSIKYSAHHEQFRGRLRTDRSCRNDRLVSVYKARPGPDPLVGRDRTDRRGDYAVDAPGDLKGRFYAVTWVKRQGGGPSHQHLCSGDRTETLRLG